jgi:hypothetical protein
MEIPFHYEENTLHLHLDRIISDQISSISSWISHLDTEHPDSTHQINLDACHPLLSEIIRVLLYCVPHYDKLRYIHIYQKWNKHYFTPELQRSLLSAIRSHPYGENITLQVDIDRKHSYY